MKEVFIKLGCIEGKPVTAFAQLENIVDVEVLSLSQSHGEKNSNKDSVIIIIEDTYVIPYADQMALAYTEDQVHGVLSGSVQSIHPVLVLHSRLSEIYCNAVLIMEMLRDQTPLLANVTQANEVQETMAPSHIQDIQNIEHRSLSLAELYPPRSRANSYNTRILTNLIGSNAQNQSVSNHTSNNPLHSVNHEYQRIRRSSRAHMFPWSNHINNSNNIAVMVDLVVPMAEVMSDEALLSEEATGAYQ